MLGMIFLKKILALILTSILASSAFAGCGEKKNKNDKSAITPEQNFSAASTSDVQTSSSEPATAPPVAIGSIEKAEGKFIYDNAGILSSADYDIINNYVGMLYTDYLINAAVVTSDDLGGLTPEQFAEEAYIDIYSGRGSGLLLLINNDTNEDYLYKKGSCQASVSEQDEKLAFYWATREIISGDIRNAVLRIMKLGEGGSQHIFDNVGAFSAESVSVLESACTSSSVSISVLATTNGTQSSNEEICQSYCDRRYSGEAGIMIMLDTATDTITTVSSGSTLPDSLETALTSANTLAAEKKYTEAVNSLITILKG